MSGAPRQGWGPSKGFTGGRSRHPVNLDPVGRSPSLRKPFVALGEPWSLGKSCLAKWGVEAQRIRPNLGWLCPGGPQM